MKRRRLALVPALIGLMVLVPGGLEALTTAGSAQSAGEAHLSRGGNSTIPPTAFKKLTEMNRRLQRMIDQDLTGRALENEVDQVVAIKRRLVEFDFDGQTVFGMSFAKVFTNLEQIDIQLVEAVHADRVSTDARRTRIRIAKRAKERLEKLLLEQARCTVNGTPGPDVLKGTGGTNVICGKGGGDKIDGKGGLDILKGGSGNDVINGGTGGDFLLGGQGTDGLLGGAGNDLLIGEGGRDRCIGGLGRDLLRGCEVRDPTLPPPLRRYRIAETLHMDWQWPPDQEGNRAPAMAEVISATACGTDPPAQLVWQTSVRFSSTGSGVPVSANFEVNNPAPLFRSAYGTEAEVRGLIRLNVVANSMSLEATKSGDIVGPSFNPGAVGIRSEAASSCP